MLLINLWYNEFRGINMGEKEIKEESLERKIRRHEVNFSTIQGGQSQDYLERYLNEHSLHENMDIVDQMVAKIDKQILKESLAKLQGQDKLILCQYLSGIKQNLIAKNFNISPSAINQRLEKIIYNYRTILCNNEIFSQSSFYDKFQSEAEYLFNAYLREVRQKGMLSIDLNEVKNLIKEIRKAITHSIMTKSNISIREQLSKQIDYSNLDDNWIKQTNKTFADYGIEAHFENLKNFKGNVVQVLKMVDDFITDLEEKGNQLIIK